MSKYLVNDSSRDVSYWFGTHFNTGVEENCEGVYARMRDELIVGFRAGKTSVTRSHDELLEDFRTSSVDTNVVDARNKKKKLQCGMQRFVRRAQNSAGRVVVSDIDKHVSIQYIP